MRGKELQGRQREALELRTERAADKGHFQSDDSRRSGWRFLVRGNRFLTRCFPYAEGFFRIVSGASRLDLRKRLTTKPLMQKSVAEHLGTDHTEVLAGLE